MPAERLAVSLDSRLAKEIREAASDDAQNVSAWLAECRAAAPGDAGT